MTILTKNETPAKGQKAEFQLDKAALALVTSVAADPYFSDSSNWHHVEMIFRSDVGNQRRIVKFDCSQANPLANFFASAKSRDIFQIEKIIINDFDGDDFTVNRSELTVAEFDIDMAQSLPLARLGQPGFSWTVSSMIQAPDNKVYAMGGFGSYNGTLTTRLVRINSDNTIDAGFVVGDGLNYAGTGTQPFKAMALQADGKLIVGGAFSTYQNTTVNYLVRINNSGGIDTSFTSGFSSLPSIWAIAVQSDGKIIVAGQFSSYGGTSVYNIVRLNTDGSRDTSFFVNTSYFGEIRSIKLLSSGKIVIGGSFTGIQGHSSQSVALLNNDGTVDTSFVTPLSWQGAGYNCLSIDTTSNGKLVVAAGPGYLSKLNMDGSFDSSFTYTTGINSTISCLAVQPDNKILLTGTFSNIGNAISRLNSDGSLDTTFDVGTGLGGSTDGATGGMYIGYANGNVLVGGHFTSYKGLTFNRAARIQSNGDIESALLEEVILTSTAGTDTYVVTGNSVQKTAGTDGSLITSNIISQQQINNGGYFEYQAPAYGDYSFIGLAKSPRGTQLSSYSYAINKFDNGFGIWEDGTNIFSSFESMNSGDIFRISIESNQVKYYKNGILRYTSLVAPSGPYYLQISLYYIGDSVSNLKVYSAI